MPKYEEIITELGSKMIKRINDDETISFIPLKIENSDYQAYLESLKDAANG